MNTLLFIALGFLSQFAHANPEKCHRQIAAEIRSAQPEMMIHSIRYTGAYVAGTVLSGIGGEKFSFDMNGFLYFTETEYYSGTGYDAYLVDERCRILDTYNIYSE